MAKQIFKLVEIESGEELVNAELTEAKIKKLIKLYQASGLNVQVAA
jgi:predicted XRE-type DNA-binding protein